MKKSPERAEGKRLYKEATKAAKLAQRKSRLIYKEKIKEMRPFLKSLKKLDLRKNLSPSQKGIVTKVWDDYTRLTSRPFKVYRSKKSDNLKKVQEYSHREKGATKFDVAFVPTADRKARVRVTKKGVEIHGKGVVERYVPFDLRRLAGDPAAEIARALAVHPKATTFVIQVGEHSYNGGISRGLLEQKVVELMMRYSPGGDGYEKRGRNSLWSNWLFGVHAYDIHSQKDYEEYRRAYQAARTKGKELRRNARKRRERKYGERF